MTPMQVALVQVSWEKILPLGEKAAQMFYERLFSLDPSLQALFKGEMKAQRGKFIAMMTFAVNGLTRVEAIVPGVEALGRRHAGYGVLERHYETVGAVLLWTLGQALGHSFTGEARQAWSAAYDTLANIMKAAARVPA